MSTFIISLILLFVVGLAIRSIIKDAKSSDGCTHNCGTCKGCGTHTDIYKQYHEERL